MAIELKAGLIPHIDAPKRLFSRLFHKAEDIPDTETEEVIDPFLTLANLQRKAGIMRNLIDTNMVEQPPKWGVRRLVRNWFADLVRDGGVEGLDHLNDAIAVAKKENKKVIVTPAHNADGDHSAAGFLLGKRRRAGGIHNEIVWMGGVNMLKRPSIAKFMRSEHVIYNVTPRDMNHLQTLQAGMDQYGFGDEQRQELGEVQSTFNEMRSAALERINATCGIGGKVLAVYIEGGRSYDGFLRYPPRVFAALFRTNDKTEAEVVPYRVYGSDKLNPPGKSPKLFRPEMLLFWRRQEISMVIGEHYSSSEVWAINKERKQEAREAGIEGKINPSEWMAANLANIDPRYVRPQERPLYYGLLKRFAPQRLNPKWSELYNEAA